MLGQEPMGNDRFWQFHWFTFLISVDWRARHLPRLHGVRVQPVPLLWGGARPRPLPPLLLQGRLWDGGGPHGGTGNPLGLLAPRGSLRSANPPTDSFPAWKPALCHKDLRPQTWPLSPCFRLLQTGRQYEQSRPLHVPRVLPYLGTEPLPFHSNGQLCLLRVLGKLRRPCWPLRQWEGSICWVNLSGG